MPLTGRRSLVLVLALTLFTSSGGAGGEGDKQPPAGANWKKLFDGKSLQGWKATDFFQAGKVSIQNGAILMEKGNQMTGVTYTRGDFPKMNYEVTLEGQKLKGNDFFCTTTFPVGNTFCSLVVGGWGGRVVGISSINGSDASDNETGRDKELKPNKWYSVRIRVTPKRIEGWIDRDKVVDLDTEGLKLSTRIECVACQPFGIATWETVGMVRDIRVRLLTEEEKKPRK